MIVWIGVYPNTFLRPMEAATAHLLEQMQMQKTMLAQPCEGVPMADMRPCTIVHLSQRGGANGRDHAASLYYVSAWGSGVSLIAEPVALCGAATANAREGHAV